MRSLIIVTDKLLYKCKDKYYTTGGFLFQIEGFNNYFEELWILTKVKKIDSLSSSHLIIDKKIKIIELNPSYFNPIFTLLNVIKILRSVNKFKFAHIRLPSLTGIIYGMFTLYKKNVKVYIGGHPEDGIINAKGKSPITLIASKLYKTLISRIVRSHETFVTGSELETYFSLQGLKVRKIISSSIKQKDIINNKKALNQKDTQIKMIYIGRLSKEKGLNFLINTMANVKKGVCLQIIGEGPLENELKQRVKDLGLQDIIEFVGGIYEREDLYQQIDNAHIFVLASITEGTPKVLLEAMARGVPVIASNVGGIPSIIKHGKNGLLFEALNEESFLHELSKLINSRELYENISEKGLAFAKENSLESLNKLLMRY